MSQTVYSIGYSGFPDRNEFINILDDHGISVLIDVRSNPYSAYYTDYNRPNLESELKKHGIYYRNYANEFGAMQPDRKYYKCIYTDSESCLNFEAFSKSEQFRSGVDKITNSLKAGYIPCFMCAEKDPIDCHRANLVTRAFYESGYEVIHIMPNGESKTQQDVEQELIEKLDLLDMTTNEPEVVIAYRKQNNKIGFKEKNLK